MHSVQEALRREWCHPEPVAWFVRKRRVAHGRAGDTHHRQTGPAALGCRGEFESVQRRAEIDVRHKQPGWFDPIEEVEEIPSTSKGNDAQTAIVEYLFDRAPQGSIRLYKKCAGHVSALSSGQSIQRIENSISSWVHGYGRQVAPEHDPILIEDEQSSLADTFAFPIGTVLPGNASLRLEIR